VKVRYSPKLMQDCLEEVSKRGRCAHYSPVKGKCTRRWAGREPEVPCSSWRKRPGSSTMGEKVA